MISNLNILQTYKTGLAFEILKAKDPATNKKFAVKIARETTLGNKRALKGLKNEWKILKSLHHKNLINYHHYGKKNSKPYLIMDWVDAENLKLFFSKKFSSGLRKISKQALFETRKLVTDIILQMVNVVIFIHNHKILHLDIKPENFLIKQSEDTTDTEIKLIDFSNARHGIFRKCFGFDDIQGTPSFISPEQIRKKKPHEKSDIYSLGATIYYVLAGHPPYSGQNKKRLLQKHLSNGHRSLYKYVPGVTHNFSLLIDQMLESSSGKRLINLAKLKREIMRNHIFLKSK